MKHQQRITVLGASGYIGRQLVSRLVAAGHRVMAAGRQLDTLQKTAGAQVEYCRVDLLKPPFPASLLAGVDTLFYLVHSMGDGADFVERERQAALNLRAALRQSPVGQIIFLSALQSADGELSPHLQARKTTGDILRDGAIPVTEIRAGIVIGAGSAAFEVMRDMVVNLPILTPPRWVRSRTSPIAIENLLYYLLHLLDKPCAEHRLFAAAGPQVLSYQQQFEHFMAITKRRRLLIPIPLPLSLISTHFLSLITSVPPSLARALIQGLKHDLLADDRALRNLLPQRLIPYDEAVRSALASARQLAYPEAWGHSQDARARWRDDYGFFAKQAGCQRDTQAGLDDLWKVVNQIGGQEGYFFGNFLWRLRGLMDTLIGHKLHKGRPRRPLLNVGDRVDSWRVIVVEPHKELTLLFGMKAPGLGRLTFTLRDEGDYRRLDVRAWWHPAGMPGLLYWLAMMPAHMFIFRGMSRRIIALAEKNTGLYKK